MKALHFEKGIYVQRLFKPSKVHKQRQLKFAAWTFAIAALFLSLGYFLTPWPLSGYSFGAVLLSLGWCAVLFFLSGLWDILGARLGRKSIEAPSATPIWKLQLQVRRIATTWGGEDQGPYWVLELKDGSRLALSGQSLMDITGCISLRPKYDKERDLVCREQLEVWFSQKGQDVFGGKTWGRPLKLIEQHTDYAAAVEFEEKLLKSTGGGVLHWGRAKGTKFLFEEVLENSDAKVPFPSRP